MLSPDFYVCMSSMQRNVPFCRKYILKIFRNDGALCQQLTKDSGNKRFLYYQRELSRTLILFQNKNTFLLFSLNDI